MIKVLSVGGSIVVPQEPDLAFISQFLTLVKDYLNKDIKRKLILVIGGGGPARLYQNAYKAIVNDDTKNNNEADWIGIMATRLNAQLIKASLGDLCHDEVVIDPSAAFTFSGRVLVAAGWKPGFSTDTIATLLAERFEAKTLVNLSNIEKVYTDDPKLNPEAKPLDSISWETFRAMVGDEWTPGKNTPFDPIASKKAESLGLKVICAGGRKAGRRRDTGKEGRRKRKK
jgi:uridylate kinase